MVLSTNNGETQIILSHKSPIIDDTGLPLLDEQKMPIMKPEEKVRIIMTSEYAKEFAASIIENLSKIEKNKAHKE